MTALFPQKKCGGGTLIEVVLAIGVLSIISLGIWGGLSVGMQRTNDLRNLTQTAQIRDYLLSQIQGGTNTITNLPSSTYYFDDEGLSLPNSSGAWAYSAQMNLVSATTPVALPNGSANTNLMSVRILLQPRSSAPKTSYYYFVHP